MHVTDYYHLGRTQGEVDFVDVNTATDNPVFIDPRAIRIQQGDFTTESVACLVTFFTEVLDAIRLDDSDKVRTLMRRLGEPNEAHLGYSAGLSRGRGLRGKSSDSIADAITTSKAAQTGLLQDLEDTAFLVPGVGRDLLSDMATQIIRGPLIKYTQRMCEYYDIPLEEQYGGSVWNPDNLEWEEGYVALPRTPEGTLLLVPKSIVRHEPIFTNSKYFNGYIAPLLEGQELQANTQLVKLLRNGQRIVTKKDLRDKYGDGKEQVVDQTLRFDRKPIELYRQKARTITNPPLVNEDIAATIGAQNVDFMAAYRKIKAIQPGSDGASMYHRAVMDLLTAIFYPALTNVKIEREIHQGRKRIDIMYDNNATVGFFSWVNRAFPFLLLPVECKNYEKDLKNPELDQMIGRFSDFRGRLGIITCRSFDNKELFLARCKDTANDRNGFIIVLDDDDLEVLAREATSLQGEADRGKRFAYPLIRQRFDMLISAS
jgi:hypothetical protein